MHIVTKLITLPALGVTALAFIIGASGDAPEREPSTPDPTAGARYACSEFIKAHLHNPRSFSPVDRLNWSVNAREDGIITVGARYRAQNAFGATITEMTYCDVVNEDGSIKLKGLRQ